MFEHVTRVKTSVVNFFRYHEINLCQFQLLLFETDSAYGDVRSLTADSLNNIGASFNSQAGYRNVLE
jgi:hypothetical protein